MHANLLVYTTVKLQNIKRQFFYNKINNISFVQQLLENSNDQLYVYSHMVSLILGPML